MVFGQDRCAHNPPRAARARIVKLRSCRMRPATDGDPRRALPQDVQRASAEAATGDGGASLLRGALQGAAVQDLQRRDADPDLQLHAVLQRLGGGNHRRGGRHGPRPLHPGKGTLRGLRGHSDRACRVPVGGELLWRDELLWPARQALRHHRRGQLQRALVAQLRGLHGGAGGRRQPSAAHARLCAAAHGGVRDGDAQDRHEEAGCRGGQHHLRGRGAGDGDGEADAGRDRAGVLEDTGALGRVRGRGRGAVCAVGSGADEGTAPPGAQNPSPILCRIHAEC